MQLKYHIGGRMKSHADRPIVAFLAKEEIADALEKCKVLFKMLRKNGVTDFGFRHSVKNIRVEDENLFAIIFIDRDASEEWTTFAAANKKNERVRIIYDGSQMEGPNLELITACFINEFQLLKNKFSQLR